MFLKNHDAQMAKVDYWLFHGRSWKVQSALTYAEFSERLCRLAMSQLWQNPTEFPSQVTLLRKDF